MSSNHIWDAQEQPGASTGSIRPAIRYAANSILVVHNHPSGDPTPSEQDIIATKRLEETAEVVGIPVIDHIVVGADRAISIQDGDQGIAHNAMAAMGQSFSDHLLSCR